MNFFLIVRLGLGAIFLTPVLAQEKTAVLPVRTEFFNADSILDTRADRLPAFFGKEGSAPSALIPASSSWQIRWQTQLEIQAKDDYHFELRGTGSGTLEIAEQTVIVELNKASAPTSLPAGKHPIKITFTPPLKGSAELRWFWKSSTFDWEPIPAHRLSPLPSTPPVAIASLRQQRRLIAEQNCLACHKTNSDIAMPEALSRAPSLSGVGSRLREDWMAKWITNPHKIRPTAHMPALFRGPEAQQKAADLASYLTTLKANVQLPSTPEGDPKKGGYLFKSLNCYACHDMREASAKRISLTDIGKKYQPGALAIFLQNPGQHYPDTRMPDFQLTQAEASDLAAFLYTLTTEEAKPPQTLTGNPDHGKQLLTQSGCLNCHDANGHQNTASFSSFEKILAAPAGQGCLAPEKTETTAPRFARDLPSIDAADAQKLINSLAQDSPAEYAERQFESLNCIACHDRDGVENLRVKLSEEVAHLAIPNPKSHSLGLEKLPSLDHLGHKLRADWMQELFAGKLETKTRPWLHARMPAWPSRAEKLATGFAHAAGLSEHHQDLQPDAADRIDTGKTLIGQSGFSCQACHAVGSQAALAVFEGAGPNLALTTNRLRPEYFHQWMHFPQRFQPASIMPRYSTNGVSTLTKYYNGDADQQFKAIYDYLNTLAGDSHAGSAPGLIGEYYHLTEGLSDTSAVPITQQPWYVRIDPKIDFPNTPHGFYGAKLSDNFLVRWTGTLTVPKDGKYTLFIASDDGSRLFIDGQKVLDFWGPHAYAEKSTEVDLKAGKHKLELVFLELGGEQGCTLSWQALGGKKEVIPPAQLSHRKANYESIAWNPEPWKKAKTLTKPVVSFYDVGIPKNYGSLIGASFKINQDSRGENIVYRAHAVPVDDEGKVGIIFDTDTMRLAATFNHGGIKFEGLPFTTSHGRYPSFDVPPLTTTGATPGWSGPNGELTDPRISDYPALGHLPKNWAHYKGLYRHGKKVVFRYTISTTTVLEHHFLKSEKEPALIARLLEIASHNKALTVVLADAPQGARKLDSKTLQLGNARVHLLTDLPGANLTISDGQARLTLPPTSSRERVEILYWEGDSEHPAISGGTLKPSPLVPSSLCKGGPAQWPEIITTQGELAPADDPLAYVTDHLTLPNKNPYTSDLRVAAFDFFADGRSAALCTWDGDLWIVKGIDEKLENLQWKLFARGIHEPLGLKIVDQKIYTVSDDQITRYYDFNNDGEADYYQNFNNDWELTSGFHAFTFDLHTDPAGNFVFAYGMPVRPGGHGFERVGIHHGAILKISKDGTSLSKYATGFRAPNGLGMSPTGQITSGDNEGTFLPRTAINWIKKGGFYGVVNAYDRRDELKTTPKLVPEPEGHQVVLETDEAPMPLAWLPKKIDNSSGGQVWVTSDKWGPLQGELLHGSYGQSKLYLVLKEEVNGQMQGGVVRIPVSPSSSIMRLRFNPADGQLYLTGLRGWQTNGGQNGGFDRVRYTGKPFDFPIGLKAKSNGLIVEFTEALDQKQAANTENYSLLAADIYWSHGYGSDEFLLGQRDLPLNEKQKGWTKLKITEARLLPDGKSVSLTVDGITPAHLMELNLNLATKEGRPIKTQINHTIYHLQSQ